MNKRILIESITCIIILMFTGLVVTAQPNNPPVPISGIEYLVAIGGALGLKKIYDIHKRKNIE